MDVTLASVTPSVANNSLPPPPRGDRRMNDFSKSSGALKSEKQRSSARRDPKSSFEARLPYLPDVSRRPSAPATYHNSAFPTGSSRNDEKSDGVLQLNNVLPMPCRGPSAQAHMECPTPPDDFSDTFYSPPAKLRYPNAPVSSSRSFEHSNEWDPNPFYVPHAFQYRQHNNSSSSPISTGRNSPDPELSPAEPINHAAKAHKILGISVSNTVSLQSGYTEHQPPRRSYGEAEHGVRWPRDPKANKLLALTPDEGTTFAPPPRSHESGLSSRTATPPWRGSSNLGRVHSNPSDRARLGSAGSAQEIEYYGRWRRESFMDFSPSVPSHQKSNSQPETLSRLPDSTGSFQTTFSVVSTDSGIPVFPKRRPESIGQSQPNTTLKTFKALMKKTDGKIKHEQAEYEWKKIGVQEADFDPWGWGVSSSGQKQKPIEWAEACTLPDEEREEQITPKRNTPDLSLAPADPLDQKERLAVIRKKRKIAQLLGMDIPPHALGPAVQDGTSTERKESWEPLNKPGTIYLDTQSNVREGASFDDSSGAFVPKDKGQSGLASSILTTNDEVDGFGMGMDMDMKGLDSPTSFMELSDEELGPHNGKANRYFQLPRQFNDVPVVEPPTPTKAPMGPSTLRSNRTFSTVTTTDLPSFPPGSQTLKHKPSFITEILEDSDWEAKERKKKRDKLAKMHRFLGSRVPAELVLGCSSGTIPPTALLLGGGEEGTGRGKGRGHGPNVGWNNEREMRNLGIMGGSEKMVQIKRAQKIEQMFGEQPPSALLRPGASLQASSTHRPSSSPPSRSASSSHSAFRPRPTSSCGPTPFATNIAHNINLLYADSSSNDKMYKNKRNDKFVPSLPPISNTNRRNSDSPSIASSEWSMTGLTNNFKQQERGWKGKAHLATPPRDMVLDITLHNGSSHNTPPKKPLKEHQSAQFLHYRKSFKSLAMIIDFGDKPALEELYAMLNGTGLAGSDTEAELAHTRRTHDVSGYESDPASPTSGLFRQSSRPSRISIVSVSSVSSASSLLTLTPEPMGFQARRKRAAKLTHFFGASYRDLFGEVLEKLEIGFLEEAKEGGLSSEEVADLMGQVKTLKKRQSEIW